MIWPDFCSAPIVGRLAPLGSRNTRFRSVPVSCSPRPVRRVRRPVSNPRPTRPGPPPAPLASLAVTGVPPRRTPRIPGSRMTLVTRPRQIPTLKRSLNSSTYATINTVPSRAAKKANTVVNISFARLNHPTTLVIIQQRESAPDSADQFHCLATPTHSFIARTM